MWLAMIDDLGGLVALRAKREPTQERIPQFAPAVAVNRRMTAAAIVELPLAASFPVSPLLAGQSARSLRLGT